MAVDTSVQERVRRVLDEPVMYTKEEGAMDGGVECEGWNDFVRKKNLFVPPTTSVQKVLVDGTLKGARPC